MPKGKLGVAVVVFALLALSGLPKAVDGQTAPWIDQDLVQQYATNMIDSYSALVASNQASNPDFQNIAQNFSLYHPAGDSFQVLVVRSTTLAIDSNLTDTVAFVFTPIQSSQPQVIVEDNETLEDLVGVTLGPAFHFGESQGHDIISPQKDGTAFFQYTMVQQGKGTTVPLIWVTSISHQVSNDTATNSGSAGNEVYDSDAAWMAAHGASTKTQTSQAQASGQGAAAVIPLAVLVVAVLVFVWARYTGKRPPVVPEDAKAGTAWRPAKVY